MGWGAAHSQAHLHAARGRPQHATHPGGAGQLQEAGLLEGLQLGLQLLQRIPSLLQLLLQALLLLLGWVSSGRGLPTPTLACPTLAWASPPAPPPSLTPLALHQLGLFLLCFQLQRQLLDLVLQELILTS